MRQLRQSPCFLVLLCVLLMVARSSGAHWHLCYDLQEPPQAVHVGDIDLHIGDGPDHQDVDLQLVDEGVTKSQSVELDLPSILTLLVLLWLLPAIFRSASLSLYFTPAILRQLFFRHALSRAPPR